MDRQIYPSYVKIRFLRSEMKGFGTTVREILSEICEDLTYARFTVLGLNIPRYSYNDYGEKESRAVPIIVRKNSTNSL